MNRPGRCLGRFILPALVVSTLGVAELASAQSLFAPTGSLNTARESHSATRLDSGAVLVAGGTNWGTTVGSAEIYNPATGAWTSSASSMRTPRSLHTAT